MTITELEFVGIVAAIVGIWSQVEYLISWPRRLLVVARRVDSDAGRGILAYLAANASSRPRDLAYYNADRMHVRPLGRTCLVFYENLIYAAQLYWWRRRPIWYAVTESTNEVAQRYVFYYLRWSIAWESLLGLVWQWDDEQREARGGRRFSIKHHGGSSWGEHGNLGEHGNRAAVPAPSGPPVSSLDVGGGSRILHWDPAHLGYAKPAGLDVMSLRPEMQALAADVDRFIDGRDWCEERGIPWRRGWLLRGPPGTGKTSFVRGVGIKHDLPIHAFDLGSMDNGGLRSSWENMLRDAPCVALIEDIDGVYGIQGDDDTWDTRALRRDGPTFDALLQCVGGVSTCDGVLLFVTTNHPDRVDAALMRGGRLDVAVEFLPPDQDGRRKLAARILGAGADVDAVLGEICQGQEISAADLQERLQAVALAQRYGEAA